MFLFKKKSRGHYYYYIAENKKVAGKSVRAWEIYVGTIEKILTMAQREKIGPIVQEVKVFEFGISAALLAICEQLQLRTLANQVTTKGRDQGVDLGLYLLLMVLNRCEKPKSKRQLINWYKESFLRRYLKVPLKSLTSQRFWDHMGYLNSDAIEQMEKALVQLLIQEFNVTSDCLLYDPTNFATYLTSHPERGNELPQRGHNKQKRFDLLQINLALLVTRDDGLPLFHDVYRGNVNDCTKFKSVVKRLIARYSEFQHENQALTLIFDKGNNSKESLQELENSPYHFVGSLRPSTQKKLISTSLEDYEEEWANGKGKITKAHRIQKKIYGVKRTVIMTYHEPSARAAEKTLAVNLAKTEGELATLRKKIGQPKSRTREAIEKRALKIVSKKQIKGLLTVTIQEPQNKGQYPSLTWHRDPEAIDQRRQGFGKSILFTDQDNWSTREIVSAYRSQWRVERDFREMKDPDHIRSTPIYHWTDDKIAVHFFSCVLALLVLRLLHRQVRQAGLDWTLEHILRTLKGIQEVAVYVGKPPKLRYTLTKFSRDQKQLFKALGLSKYSKEENPSSSQLLEVNSN